MLNVGLDVNQRIEFVSKEDTTEPYTIFILKPLRSFEQMELSSLLISKKVDLKSQEEVGKNIFSHEYLTRLFSLAIAEIKNPDIVEKQEIIKYLQQINVAIIYELIDAVLGLNTISGQDAKNS